MSTFLHKIQSISDYQSYILSEEFSIPNTCLCKNEGIIKYVNSVDDLNMTGYDLFYIGNKIINRNNYKRYSIIKSYPDLVSSPTIFVSDRYSKIDECENNVYILVNENYDVGIKIGSFIMTNGLVHIDNFNGYDLYMAEDIEDNTSLICIIDKK